MTDEELIARLREMQGQVFELIAGVAAKARIVALTKERDEAKAMQSCGCSYDTPTDVCLGHYRLFERLYAVQRGRLEAKLAKAVKALHNAAIQLDWCQAAREISKEIDATLAEIKGESHD